MTSEQEITDFQAALMENLYSCEDPQKMLEQLKNDSQLAAFREYLKTFDVTMVLIGAELIKKWGVRKANK